MAVATLEPPVITPVPARISVQEYLERERHSSIRHEYVDGELIPMPGTTLTHNDIAVNIATSLKAAFRGRKCFVQLSDIRLRVSPTRYRYPDVIAVCGERETDNETPPSLLNPSLIVEVLSASTESEDRGEKWEEYRRIPTLTDYLLVASDRAAVAHYSRQEAQQWTVRYSAELTDTVSLVALDATLSLTDIYEAITFAPEPEPAPESVPSV